MLAVALTATVDGKRLGTVNATVTGTSRSPATFEKFTGIATVASHLTDGDIYGQAYVTPRGTTGVITGGTRAYREANGTLTSDRTKDVLNLGTR